MSSLGKHPAPQTIHNESKRSRSDQYATETGFNITGSQVLGGPSYIHDPIVPLIGDYDCSSWTFDTGANGPEEICYGKLHDIDILLRWCPKEWDTNVVPEYLLDGQSIVRLTLDQKEEATFLRTRASEPEAVGVLSLDLSGRLQSLIRLEIVRFELLVAFHDVINAFKKLQYRSSRDKRGVRAQADILFFGTELNAHDVAKQLAALNLYLQVPVIGSFHCQYDNPQSLSFPEIHRQPNQDIVPHFEGMAGGVRTQGQNTLVHCEDTQEGEELITAPITDILSLVSNIDSFFNTLPQCSGQSDLLPKIQPKIHTALLPHQQLGVGFMIEREGGVPSKNRCLWESNEFDSGETYYQHVITGAKSRDAEDCRGGILADDMGLGKTLTTLSVIIQSLGVASAFALAGGDRCAKSTIVVVPSELLLVTWIREIERHIAYGTLRYVRFHGSERRSLEATLPEYDLILTTYGTLMVELRKRNTSAIYAKHWHRVVLDEAHTIRNSSSKQFQAAHNLGSNIKWCLTGTPIQNSLDDLGSLVRFLQVPVFDDPSTFRKHISKVRVHTVTLGEPPRMDFENLSLLLSSICLRRSKTVLPGLGYSRDDRRLDFTQQESDEYTTLLLSYKRAIDMRSKGVSVDMKHSKVMEAFLRLRMFCNNGLGDAAATGPAGLGAASQPDEVLSLLQQSNEAVCSFCTVDVPSASRELESDSAYLTRCLRLVCRECLPEYLAKFQTSSSAPCSLCQKQHGLGGQILGNLPTLGTSARRLPSKIISLIQDVDTYYLRSKCVIFSFWKTTLDIVGQALGTKNIKYLRVDGDTTSKRRNKVLLEFQKNDSARVLMMTFSTGAVGLNGLTVANRIHILEPQWNPAQEDQAIGRVVRIDQASQVTVIRYLMVKSIEETVQSRQIQKLKLAGGGFDEKTAHHITQLEELLGWTGLG